MGGAGAGARSRHGIGSRIGNSTLTVLLCQPERRRDQAAAKRIQTPGLSPHQAFGKKRFHFIPPLGYTAQGSRSVGRLKSPVVWTSLAAQALSVMVLMGVFDTGVSDAVKDLVAGLLQLLVVLGVLNNPTDGSSF